jgi:hypothetical protein
MSQEDNTGQWFYEPSTDIKIQGKNEFKLKTHKQRQKPVSNYPTSPSPLCVCLSLSCCVLPLCHCFRSWLTFRGEREIKTLPFTALSSSLSLFRSEMGKRRNCLALCAIAALFLVQILVLATGQITNASSWNTLSGTLSLSLVSTVHNWV